MNELIPIVGITALLGTALIGGVFFAFSSFVMKALGRVPCAEGVAAMQSINVVVINPWFLGPFMGSALLSLAVVALVLDHGNHPSAPFFLAGAVSYVAGTFLVTLFGNVPLNERLAAVSAKDPATRGVWDHYLNRWTMWNHVRAVAAMLAALLFTVGLAQSTGT